MTLYALVIQDRHEEPQVYLFSSADKAIVSALGYLEYFKESMADVADEDATMSEEDLAAAGWLFYACYSEEGDCLWVVPREVDAEVVE